MAPQSLKSLLLLAISPLAAANCAYGTSHYPREPQVPASTFSYEYLEGPLNWYGLNETANKLCDIGKNQSPIILNGSVPTVAGSSFNFTVEDYADGAEFENLGTNVEVVVNGTLIDGGKTYKLAQFHFHSPSEHRIAREFYPMEWHWVFQASDKSMAVLAFLIDVCEGHRCGNSLLETIFDAVEAIPDPGNATMTDALTFEPLIKQVASDNFWKYTGSLTTPPCTESVIWIVDQNVLQIQLSTWKSVRKVIKYNARFTQDSLGAINLLQNAGEELAAMNNL